jgi:hypothetical protein
MCETRVCLALADQGEVPDLDIRRGLEEVPTAADARSAEGGGGALL